jgi:hypothetical protein
VTRESDSLDPELAALFADDTRRLDEQPFVAATLRALRRRRMRTAVTRVVLRVAGVVAIAALSPYAIRLSLAMSAWLDRWFSAGAGALATPRGIALAAVAAMGAALLIERRRPGVFRSLLFDVIR